MTHKAYIHQDYGDEVVIKHPAYPDLNITMPRKLQTDQQMLERVDTMFAAGELGPIPDGYSITKNAEPEKPVVVDYTDWVSCYLP